MGTESAGEPIASRTLRAALHRLYFEGHYVWSRSDVEKTLPIGVALDASYIQDGLLEWDARGLIRILGRDDAYLEVLDDFPASEIGSFG